VAITLSGNDLELTAAKRQPNREFSGFLF